MPSDRIRELHYDLSNDLARIAKRFKNPKLTLVVRNPDFADGDILMGDDDPDLAIAAIRKMRDRDPV